MEPGIPRELAGLRQATLSEVVYAFALTIPEEAGEPVRGRLGASFVWNDPQGRDLVFDFKEPSERVHGLEVNGESAVYATPSDHVVVPAAALRPGANRVEIEFQAGDEALNRNPEFLYTLFVPDRAHFSLPLFDQPGLKARFRLELEVPAAWTAVANGPLEEETEAAGGMRRLRFAETEPLPTYLFAFAAGRFEVEEEERDGRTLRMFHRETDEEKLQRSRQALFDLHFAALDWLEDYTGIPYPFAKLDFVLVPAFQYGGMEHAGAIFYRDARLLLDESATQNDVLGRASLIAHETAHMWFGDLVTMEWFDDVWMKEVFANFMAAKIVHPSFPEVDHDLRFLLAHHPGAYEVDRTAGANPIRQPLENLNEAGTLYGAIIYQKAPIMMRQLELAVGEEAFRDGLQEYLESNRYGNASWPDLIAILDLRSPEDLAAWSRVWVEEPGRPTISVEVAPRGERIGRLVVNQEDPADAGRLWPQEVAVVLGRAGSSESLSVRLASSSTEVPEASGLPLPALVLPDGSGLGYARFRVDETSRQRLMSALPSLADALVRGASWVTLWDALLEREVEPGPFLDLCLAALPRERDEQNLELILGYLGTAYWRLLTPEERSRRAHEVESALWEEIERAETSTAKGAVFRRWRDTVLTPEAIERLRRIWTGELEVAGLELAEEDLTEIAWELAVREVEGWSGILDEQAERIENPDRRARFDFVRPALAAEPATREAFFESLRDAANREREPWVLTGVAYLHHPLRSAHAERFISPSLELLEEIQRTGDIFFPKRWLDATLGGHATPAAAAMVRRFLEARPDYPPRLRAKILQSTDMLERAARIAGR